MGKHNTKWIHGRDEQPADDDIFDVWVPTVDAVTGERKGHRVCNCWLFGGEVLHGNPPVVIRGSTHWTTERRAFCDGPEQTD